jgi:hypothetical protein
MGLGLAHIQVGDLTPLVDATINFVQSAALVITNLVTLYGIVRKVIRALKAPARRPQCASIGNQSMDWAGIVAIGLYAVSCIGVFVGRNWIKARIERSVQHGFDAELEAIRADLRKAEETFKSDLRLREQELSALRDGVLSGRAQRQAALDKRRMEAVERVWQAVGHLGRYKTLSGFMNVLDYDKLSQAATSNPVLRTMFKDMAGEPSAIDSPEISVQSEQPFISELAWAYFTAYRAILFNAFSRAKLLELGVEEPLKLLKEGYVEGLIKVAVPHWSDYVDNRGKFGFHILLDHLEDYLLTELRKMLEGADVDQAGLQRAAQIMEASKQVIAEAKEQTAQSSAE